MTDQVNAYKEYIKHSVDFIERIHDEENPMTEKSVYVLSDPTLAAMSAGYLYAWMSHNEIEQVLEKVALEPKAFTQAVVDEINNRLGGKNEPS